jgi:hypothetical protein
MPNSYKWISPVEAHAIYFLKYARVCDALLHSGLMPYANYAHSESLPVGQPLTCCHFSVHWRNSWSYSADDRWV